MRRNLSTGPIVGKAKSNLAIRTVSTSAGAAAAVIAAGFTIANWSANTWAGGGEFCRALANKPTAVTGISFIPATLCLAGLYLGLTVLTPPERAFVTATLKAKGVTVFDLKDAVAFEAGVSFITGATGSATPIVATGASITRRLAGFVAGTFDWELWGTFA